MPFEDTTNMQQGFNKESIDRYEVPQDAMKMVKYEICGNAGVGNEINQAGNAPTTDASTQTDISIQDFQNLHHKSFIIRTDDHPQKQFRLIESKNGDQIGRHASTVIGGNMNKKQSVSMPFEDTTNMQQGFNKESIDRYEVPLDVMDMVKYEICGKAGVGNEIKQAGNGLEFNSLQVQNTDTSTATDTSKLDNFDLDRKSLVISTNDHPQRQFKVINSKRRNRIGRPATKTMGSNRLHVNEYSCKTCGTRKTSMWRRDDSGQRLCNACKLYKIRNGFTRPSRLHNKEIQKRTHVFRQLRKQAIPVILRIHHYENDELNNFPFKIVSNSN
ncbi:hypothetical protein GJ496_003636 [Pomphorhynchus laevis]|nr:hypothetical protein GJ496_003636 [Pomphorhynchus laevis]